MNSDGASRKPTRPGSLLRVYLLHRWVGNVRVATDIFVSKLIITILVNPSFLLRELHSQCLGDTPFQKVCGLY